MGKQSASTKVLRAEMISLMVQDACYTVVHMSHNLPYTISCCVYARGPSFLQELPGSVIPGARS